MSLGILSEEVDAQKLRQRKYDSVFEIKNDSNGNAKTRAD